jgi:hypothetical protein
MIMLSSSSNPLNNPSKSAKPSIIPVLSAPTYWSSRCFGAGGCAGRGFLAVLEAGLDMPKLRRNK